MPPKTVEELREFLTSIGLDATGKRDELLGRVFEAASNIAAAKETDKPQDDTSTPFHDARRRLSTESVDVDLASLAHSANTPIHSEHSHSYAESDGTEAQASATTRRKARNRKPQSTDKMASIEANNIAKIVSAKIDAEMSFHRERMIAETRSLHAEFDRERQVWRHECEEQERRQRELERQLHVAQSQIQLAEQKRQGQSGRDRERQQHRERQRATAACAKTSANLRRAANPPESSDSGTRAHARTQRQRARTSESDSEAEPAKSTHRHATNSAEQRRQRQPQMRAHIHRADEHARDFHGHIQVQQSQFDPNPIVEQPPPLAHAVRTCNTHEHEQANLRYRHTATTNEHSRVRNTHTQIASHPTGLLNDSHRDGERAGRPHTQRGPERVDTWFDTNRSNMMQPDEFWHPRMTISQIAEQLPIFDPEDPIRSSSKIFIQRVQVLAEYHRWTDRSVVIAVQTKLRGAAEVWNESSSPHYESFADFAHQLRATFPDLQTEADIHEELVRATRAMNEDIQSFCHRMVAIARKGNLPERIVVHYILKRIDHDSFSISVINTPIDTLRELYGAIARFRQAFPSSTAPKNSSSSAAASDTSSKQPTFCAPAETHLGANATPKQPEPTQTTSKNSSQNRNHFMEKRPLYCENCKKRGHAPDRCPEHRVECTNCNRLGHLANACRKTTVMVVQNDDSGALVKDVFVNNVRMKAFIDGGSKESFIRRSATFQIGREEPCDPVAASGFGSDKKHICDTCISPTIILGVIVYRSRLYVVDDEILPASLPDILLGTKLLCQNGNRLIISEGTCVVEPTNKSSPIMFSESDKLVGKHSKCFSKSLPEPATCISTADDIALNIQQTKLDQAGKRRCNNRHQAPKRYTGQPRAFRARTSSNQRFEDIRTSLLSAAREFPEERPRQLWCGIGPSEETADSDTPEAVTGAEPDAAEDAGTGKSCIGARATLRQEAAELSAPFTCTRQRPSIRH